MQQDQPVGSNCPRYEHGERYQRYQILFAEFLLRNTKMFDFVS